MIDVEVLIKCKVAILSKMIKVQTYSKAAGQIEIHSMQVPWIAKTIPAD